MHTIQRLLVAAATSAAICGVASASASAYAISGGPYNAGNTGPARYTFGGGLYALTCSTANFSGNATGSATTVFTPTYLTCALIGFPVGIMHSGTWSATITGGPTGGTYTGALTIPSTASSTYSAPIVGCSVTVAGPQSFPGSVTASNTGSGISGAIDVTGISYTAVGCPFPSGTDGTYRVNLDAPGVTIS